MDLKSLPFEQIQRSRKRMRRELLEIAALQPLRIAVLGGPTTNELVDFLELLLLSDGFSPTFYQSEYNRFYEDATLDIQNVKAFKPDIVYIHTHFVSISGLPAPHFTEDDLRQLLDAELARFDAVWESIHENVGCQIIQNNFEHPPFASIGNIDSWIPGGQSRFVYELNIAFAHAASRRRHLLINDINAIAARIGLSAWFDWNRWYSYKIFTTPEASFELARSLASMIGALRGRVKKCLILDLDNTLWGGVIGDDGLDRIQIGMETAQAEAYTAFQKYCLNLRERGILLAVCSKNDEATARTGFTHPDSVLKLEHFAAFKANWLPKPDNIQQIALELSLGLDSFVFVDDNPAERAIVEAQLPTVAVPDVGSEVSGFQSIIQAGRYFEMVSFSQEDLGRAAAYVANQARTAVKAKFSDYGAYLDSLQMTAEIGRFKSVYLERITQLINKTNQFNLTTRRYTTAEIEQIASDNHYIALFGRLTDTFGDNGLVSVIIGRMAGAIIHLDLWIMSCRVLKREMEFAMLDALVEHAQLVGATDIVGYYRRTPKNSMVEDHYQSNGFELESSDELGESTCWHLAIGSYKRKNNHIKVR